MLLPKLSNVAGTTSPRSGLPNWLSPLLPLGVLAFLTALFTYPTLFHFTDSVSGVAVEDRLQNLWNFWWIKQAVLRLQNPYLTDKLFFPYYQPPQPALPLYFHDLQLFNGLFTLPLQLWGGVAAAYNGVVIGATLGSAGATYWLIRKLGGSRAGAITGGALFAFAPVRLEAIAQSITNIQSTEFLPLYAALLYLATSTGTAVNKGPGWRATFGGRKGLALIGAILTLSACIYTDWYNTIYLLAYSLLFFGWHLISQPRQFKLIAGLVLVVGIGTFLLIAPLLVPSIANLNNPAFRLVPGYDRELKSSATVVGLFVPTEGGRHSPLLTYTGLILVGMACLFLLKGKQAAKGNLFRRWRITVNVIARAGKLNGQDCNCSKKEEGKGNQQDKLVSSSWLSAATCRYWLLVVMASCILALGPELRLTQQTESGLPLPYALFRLLPVVSVTRNPSRFLILAMLGVAVLAAFVVDWLASSQLLTGLLKFLPSRYSGSVLASLILLLLVAELWTPLPLFEVKPNPFMERLAGEAGHFNLLELPITRHYNHDQVRMFNQITHGRPIMGGYLSRPVVDPYRTPDSPFAPLADLVIRAKRQPRDIVPFTTNEQDLDTLVRLYNFRYVVLYLKEFDDPLQLAGLSDLLERHYGIQQMVYKDNELAVYRVPNQLLTEEASSTASVKLELGSGWYQVEASQNQCWRWANKEAVFYATTFAEQSVHLSVAVRTFETPRHLQLQLNGKPIFEREVSPTEAGSLETDLILPRGRNELRLLSQEEAISPRQAFNASQDTRLLAFAVSSITAEKMNH